jgi:ABC-2 type transport system permease protein
VIPSTFATDIDHLRSTSVQVITDASDPNRASTLTTYLRAIIADEQASIMEATSAPVGIATTMRMMYNPQLRGAPNFVPGVMALVLMLVCVMMTSIAIVREKELGTMEVLLVSPFRPFLVIVAKVIPYFALSLINVGSILLLSVYVLDLPIRGSVLLLYAVSMVFIITSLALGLLVSTVARTQQVAMLISMMGMLLPTLLFSGFMFPIENMPVPLRVISNIIPAKWYYNIVKAVMIKGLGIEAIWREVLILTGMTVVVTMVSVRRFSVRLS